MEAFKQELYENGCFRQEELVFRDCDRDQRVRVAALLSRLGAFAGYDYDARGLTHELLWANREVFLLSRASIKIHDCPHARDVLDITTWEAGAKAAHMRRNYEMRDRQGRARVSARTDWILVDPVTRKIMRPSAFTAKPLMDSDRPLDCPETRKVVLPREGRENLGTRTVRWSDLDGNGHLFSGNYGDIVWDALPEDLQPLVPQEFHINYSREAVLGDTLTLEGFRGEKGYYMEGLGPRGSCFTALCVF
ncbi:acyl-[acyl-carrier-protein] thioesterase [uncultured Oscillibacter sp.]|uniref:acyl-[acyl-carrier-protein] thioesterase n=1 Tax=uncultured Oscillibacter sp. TaxID=876091 RepID=UPI002624995E|nr:acyl-ACP thioesterase domain-containing protein [uncultured Oscillibacter sp.]